MDATLSPEQVLSALNEADSILFHVKNDLFCNTWQSSHFRILEMWPSNTDQALPPVVAHAFVTDTQAEYSIEQWLPNAKFTPCSFEEIADFIRPDALLNDELNETIAFAFKKLPIDGEFAYKVERISQTGPSLPYHYGPTYIYFWGRSGWIYYLQAHYES